MKALSFKITNDHNRQSARLRVITTETGQDKRDVATVILRPSPDDGRTPVLHVQRYVIGGHEFTVELKITPSEFPPFLADNRSA